MTRKKFVKMLMEAGMSRNNAAECAKLAQEAQRPYTKVLGDMLTYHRAKFKQHFVLEDRRVHAAIIHGTNSMAYKVLCGIAYIRPPIYEVSLVQNGGYPLSEQWPKKTSTRPIVWTL
jgi:hypothetical protein